MPRAPAFRIDAIADLLRQLEYAPAETRRRQMDAAERLVGEIDTAIAYPRAFVVYRITGYRPEADDEMVAYSGGALRPDLVNLVQRLSDELELPPQRDGHTALSLEDVRKRLAISPKTLQRYRRESLVCHYVMDKSGEKRLACFADALERFNAARPKRVGKAARFTRMGDDLEARIIQEARDLRQAQRLSLNAAALRLARQHGRAHETLRQLLRKHDRGAAQPIFTERGPLTERETAIIHRAWIRGMDLAPLSQHFGRSRGAIHRAITRRRVDLLPSVRLTHIDLPTFALEGAEAVVLSSPHVSQDLLALPPHEDALRLLEWASAAEAMDEGVEDGLLGGWNLLKKRASEGIDGVRGADTPSSEVVDAIETDLRWASLLHRRLTLAAFPAALRRIEFNLGRSLLTQPAEHIVTLITLATGVIREALEGVDPSRGQRLERVVAFAMERELATRSRLAAASTRAAARHGGGAIPLGGAFDALDEWEPRLIPWRRARDRLNALESATRELLALRYGWDGGPPHTIIALAQRLKVRAPGAALRVQKAIRELRAMLRANGTERGT